jgi:hypothetical protein
MEGIGASDAVQRELLIDVTSFIDNDFKGYLLNKVEHLTNESRQMTDCEEW